MTKSIQLLVLLLVVALFNYGKADDEEGSTPEQQQADKEQWAKLFQILENQQKAQPTQQPNKQKAQPTQQPNKQKPPQKFPQQPQPKPQPQRPQQQPQLPQQQQNLSAQRRQQWLQLLKQWPKAQYLNWLQQYWQSQVRPQQPLVPKPVQAPSKTSEQDLLLSLWMLDNFAKSQ